MAETGSFDILVNPDKEGEAATPRSMDDGQWKSKHRLSTIVLNITRSPTFSAWMWIFLLLAVVVIVFAASSLGASEDAVPTSETLVILPQGDFVYEPLPGMPYPSCQLSKGLVMPGAPNSTALIDYAFLAGIVYQSPDLIQGYLDQWFGEGFAVNDEDIVNTFRQEVPGGQAAVAYFLISFPSVNSAIVVVRGSTTSWEWLTDAQLWGSAAVAQVIRFLLPVGELFTPILDELLLAVSWVEAASLQKIALYKQTTSFVQALQADGNFTKLQITGHSLGGGIAIITGAQTGIPAIAVSGPNALLSRKTFQPPVTEEELNTNIFNIVPDRDIMPRIDDLADLYQRIQCRGPANDLWACHSVTRSLCEIAYQCGTGNRPALCVCATEKGYPEPEQVGGSATFTDLCGTQRSNT
jgi:lipase ATG15